jgi:hypothetical protein
MLPLKKIKIYRNIDMYNIYWYFVSFGFIIFVVMASYVIFYKGISSTSTKQPWTHTKTHIFFEILIVVVMLGLWRHEEVTGFFLSGENEGKVESLIELVTFSSTWQNFLDGSPDNSDYLIAALVALSILWIIGFLFNIIRNWFVKETKKYPLFKRGTSGNLFVILLFIALLFFLATILMDGSSNNGGGTVEVDLTRQIVGGSEEEIMYLATIGDVKLPRPTEVDGVTVRGVCAKIVEPKWLYDQEGFPTEQLKFVKLEISNAQGIELTKKMKGFLGANDVRRVTVEYTLIRTTLGAPNTCDHLVIEESEEE